MQQPSLTRLRELVPPWPLSLYNQGVDGGGVKKGLNFKRKHEICAEDNSR